MQETGGPKFIAHFSVTICSALSRFKRAAANSIASGIPLLSAIFLLYGLSIMALVATQDLVIAAAVLLVTGFCAGAFDVLQQTLIQMAVPDEQRGRAVGVWVLSIGSAPVGHLEMGTLAAAIGTPIALLINGALTAASAAALLARAPDYRWMRLTRPKAHILSSCHFVRGRGQASGALWHIKALRE